MKDTEHATEPTESPRPALVGDTSVCVRCGHRDHVVDRVCRYTFHVCAYGGCVVGLCGCKCESASIPSIKLNMRVDASPFLASLSECQAQLEGIAMVNEPERDAESDQDKEREWKTDEK